MSQAPRPRVLVVEDEPSIAETLEYTLETEGFHVALAGTGGEALAKLGGEGADFVVLDVGLPDMSGFDVCREIRRSSTVPILFLTAREGEIDRVVGLELGADDYVVKPFSPRELSARVRAILRRATAAGEKAGRPGEAKAEAPSMRHGEIAIDAERFRVEVAGNPVILSRYEFGMLKVFVRHPGRVYTRDQLMDLVWDEPEASLDRTVDAHIKSLRAKLRDAGLAEDAILTHRGVGYSLREG
ncbi:MAG: two-component system response regulator CreB [Verrucomicrobiae bacterium]|nr:two-component system response regulator CreB [Verrucomicrobiae bacterium]